jgi:hypothetical protein
LVFANPRSAEAQQIVHTAQFTQKLEAFAMIFHEPEIRYFHANANENGAFGPFDLCLIEDNGSVEYKYIFVDESEIRANMPHLYASNAVTHAASNDESQWIIQKGHTEHESLNKYGADWSNQSKFTPKETFSTKNWCRQLAIYKHGVGLALIYICYDELDDLPDGNDNLLQFIDPRN